MLIWELPVRVFHWALVALVATSWITGELGGVALQYHFWSGYAVLTLLLFRLVWGVLGSEHARFTSFVRGPRAVFATVRSLATRAPLNAVGHNPVGALMVLALLAGLLLQTGTGLFANDDLFNEGPLYQHMSKAMSDRLTAIHQFNVGVLLTLITLHIAAIAYHWWVKGENLLRPMLAGFHADIHALPTGNRSAWVALGWWLLCVAAVAYGINQ